MKVAVCHSQIPHEATKDEQDILVQVEAISQALSNLGFEPIVIPFSLNLEITIAALQKARPEVVFNLVETVCGSGRFVHLAPTVLDYLRLPYTGSGTEALFLTSNKLLAKKILKSQAIPTPSWMTLHSTPEEGAASENATSATKYHTQTEGHTQAAAADGTSYIIKSVWEHASIGLDESSVIATNQRTTAAANQATTDEQDAQAEHTHHIRHIRQEMERRKEIDGQDFFAEIYIDGREFNLSLLAGDSGPEVLPPAEIHFQDYPAGKLKIVDYRAKWEEESFEYSHTPRCFDFPTEDHLLLKQLSELAKKCWYAFELAGYARVDFRVDQAGKPWGTRDQCQPLPLSRQRICSSSKTGRIKLRSAYPKDRQYFEMRNSEKELS